MTNTTYRFTKNGKSYNANGANRFEAQLNVELSCGIDLRGAKFEEIYKLKTIRTGFVY